MSLKLAIFLGKLMINHNFFGLFGLKKHGPSHRSSRPLGTPWPSWPWHPGGSRHPNRTFVAETWVPWCPWWLEAGKIWDNHQQPLGEFLTLLDISWNEPKIVLAKKMCGWLSRNDFRWGVECPNIWFPPECQWGLRPTEDWYTKTTHLRGICRDTLIAQKNACLKLSLSSHVQGSQALIAKSRALNMQEVFEGLMVINLRYTESILAPYSLEISCRSSLDKYIYIYIHTHMFVQKWSHLSLSPNILHSKKRKTPNWIDSYPNHGFQGSTWHCVERITCKSLWCLLSLPSWK